MRATRIRDLLLLAVLAGVAAYLLVREYYGSMPGLSWYAPVSLPVLAVAEAVVGSGLRARILRKPGARPVEPLVAARSVALAKASSIVGALMIGGWGGLLGYVIPNRDVLAAARSDTIVGIVGAAGALCLVVAALWLEYCCRAPKPPDDEEREKLKSADQSGH